MSQNTQTSKPSDTIRIVKPGTLAQAVDTWYRLHAADFDECEIREAIAHLQRLMA